MKKILCLTILMSMLFSGTASAETPSSVGPAIKAPSAILMEKETGTVIYEKNADEPGFPASITKIMTMLLIVEDIENGAVSVDDIVTASARASSFGGSCVYLEQGEQMSVHEMLKCIAVVSANDCAVAMAEHLSGSEEVFVSRMNEKAKELGMSSTHFSNCTGLFDDGEHFTTAHDVALMSRELISHELIKQYTTIWMDSIRNGEFGLSNTNKLVYWYSGCTGLKTGYTSTSKYCLSATAERSGTEYIAVVMHCDTPDERNRDAEQLLNYAFANYHLVPVRDANPLPELPVELGKSGSLTLELSGGDKLLLEKGGEPEYSIILPERVSAPVKKGQRVGTLRVSTGKKQAAEIPICAAEDIPRTGFFGIFARLAAALFAL